MEAINKHENIPTFISEAVILQLKDIKHFLSFIHVHKLTSADCKRRASPGTLIDATLPEQPMTTFFFDVLSNCDKSADMILCVCDLEEEKNKHKYRTRLQYDYY